MALSRGTPLGSLIIEEKLASGETGESYLARQPALDRWVVVRKLPADMMIDGRDGRFVREGRLAARVIHPNVLAVLDCFSLQGEYYRVEERVEGESLETLLAAKGHLPRRVALAIVLEIARGIRALHERHIVHCGLNPSTVIVSRWGDVKLIGLCDARDLDDDSPPSAIPESPYAAPEAIAGVGVDARADLYSLGSLAQALVTGSPFGRRTAVAALQGCRSESPGDRPMIREAITHLEGRMRNSGSDLCRSEIAAYLWGAHRSQGRSGSREAEALAALGVPSASGSRSSFWSRERLSGLHLSVRGNGPLPRLSRVGIAAFQRLSTGARSLRARLPLPSLRWASIVAILLAGALSGGGLYLSSRSDPAHEFDANELAPVSSGAATAVLPLATPSGRGQVTFVVYPWAEVTIDAESPFLTPRAEPVWLTPGTHEVMYSHPRFGVVHSTLEVAASSERVVRYVFNPADRR